MDNFPKNKDPVSETIASYQAKAHEYIENTKKLDYFPDLPAMLSAFGESLSGKSVLDVAFGSGRDSEYLLEHGISVVGAELTQAFLDAYNLPNQIVKMDMRRLGFADSSFDGLWCCAAFLHIPRNEAQATLKEFSRVLRPNGVLYFDLKEGEGDEWKSDGNVSEAARYFTYYSLEAMADLLRNAQLQIVLSKKQKHARQSEKPGWLNLLCQKQNM